MQVEKLIIKKRAEKGTRQMKQLRKKGFVPGILYGHKTDPLSIAVTKDELMHLIQRGKHMVDLELEGNAERALFKEIQYDAMGDNVVHVDFARVAMDEEVTVTVPIVLTGSAVGITHGGVLQHIIKELQVTCLPGDIPDSISLRVNDLDIDAIVHIKDLPPTPRVKYHGEPEQIVLLIVKPVIEEVAPVPAAEAAAAEAAEPEVLTKRKPEEEEEGEEAAEKEKK